MPKQLKKCPKCGKYSISEQCKFCNTQTKTPHPPKFSINDKYAKYRRTDKNTIAQNLINTQCKKQ